MNKLITIVFLVLSFCSNTFAQLHCEMTAPNIVCHLEKVSVTYSTDANYDSFSIIAFTNVNGVNVPALINNNTDISADIVFLEPGNAEIVVRYFQGGTLVGLCNQNVFVFGEEPISSFGTLSNFVEDQVACGGLDLEFTTFIECGDCPQEWTIDGTVTQLDQETFGTDNFTSINTHLVIEELGSYELCHKVMKQDSTCFIEDCIQIDIIEIEEPPVFIIADNTDVSYCLGSSITFENETISDQELIYHWTVTYDSLSFNYYIEDLVFDFNFPGEYQVTLQYIIADNALCISPEASISLEIQDSPIIPISCSGTLCETNEITYRAPVICSEYEWIVDPEHGTITFQEDSTITILWLEVDQYTETEVILFTDNCSSALCDRLVTQVQLFPSQIEIDGTTDLCQSGIFTYEAELIPNTTYEWEIIATDSIAGPIPEIDKIYGHIVDINVFSFVGSFDLIVKAIDEDRNCEVSNSISLSRYNILFNDDLCLEDLFKAELLPKINEDIIWTLTDQNGSIVKQETKSGLQSFLAFNLPNPGTYNINISIPALDYTCADGHNFNVLPSPAVDLEGPLFVCTGEMLNYTLSGLGGNDIVEWTVFQDNGSMTYEGNTISVTWIEGGGPYIIKVKRSTRISETQICESEDFVFTISPQIPDDYNIMGADTICYDGVAIYSMPEQGAYNWEIIPEEIGTIIDGDDTESVTIQWHYAPDIKNAILSNSDSICGDLYEYQMEVTFEPYVPEIDIPDVVCQNMTYPIKIDELSTYQSIDYYVSGVLEGEDILEYNHRFVDTGFVEVRIVIVNPDGCPGVVDSTEVVYVSPNPTIGFEYSIPYVQCPKESFQDVIITADLQDPNLYYTWELDTLIQKEGFGSSEIYSQLITKETMNTFGVVKLTVETPDGCSSSFGIPLDYSCDTIQPPCMCIEDPEGSIDYITRHECNLISFGGSLDFSTVLSAEWRISQGDTITSIPILTEADLIQDSIYLSEGLRVGDVVMAVTCTGGITLTSGVFIDAICNFVLLGENFQLYYPEARASFQCNDQLNYDVTLNERRYVNTAPVGTYTQEWTINGQTYSGIEVFLPNQIPNSDLNISIKQCDLDGSYCCTNDTIIKVIEVFDPQIILPNGSCENDLWLFTLDGNPDDIESVLWDFGDGSGSTLLTTEKGFDDTLSHDIIVTVTDGKGCTVTDSLTVETFPNNINGSIDFESDLCAFETSLSYVEMSESIIANYEWSIVSAGDTSSIFVNQSGTYQVTVTDENGCTAVEKAENVEVNASFSGGIVAKSENCGIAQAYITAKSGYDYSWYINGVLTAMGSSIGINSPGTYDIKVVSKDNMTETVCDSVTKTIVVFSNPPLPDVVVEKTFCDPVITTLSVLNYDEITWTSAGLYLNASSLETSQNGLYTASHVDENGCDAKVTTNINNRNITFENINELCIQACREDLDSLMLSIPGTSESYDSWTWSTLDTLGIEMIIQQSSGNVSNLMVTDKMYDYIELTVVHEGCTFSERVPLDIITCALPPDEEIICESIDHFSSSCGHTIYKCLVSEENGGPVLYYEGTISPSEEAFLCNPDSISASMNNGHINILSFQEHILPNGSIHFDYTANIIIDDAEDFEANSAIIRFDFCDDEGENTYCIEYLLPHRTCNTGFDCLVNFEGLSSGVNNSVNFNYCLNLHDIVQEDCTLNSYDLEFSLINDLESKIIYESNINQDFDQLICIEIPVSMEDFLYGNYNCVEMIITGDCPDILCSDFQCGLFSNNLVTIETEAHLSAAKTTAYSSLLKIDKYNSTLEKALDDKFKIYPNPTTGLLNIEILGISESNTVVITNSLGNKVLSIEINEDQSQIDMSNYPSGVYFATVFERAQVNFIRKIVLLN